MELPGFVFTKFTRASDNDRMTVRTTEPRYAGTRAKHRELRAARRRSVDDKGWIRLDGGFARRSCTILDISDVGVRFRIKAHQEVAPVFHLLSGKTGGLGRRARVKWRRGNEIGAEFF